MDVTNVVIPGATGGRLVMGNPLVGFDKERGTGKPYLDKNGLPVTKFYFNVAVPKTDPSVNGIISQIIETAKAGFPHMFQSGVPGFHQFAYKYIDGDSPDLDQGGTRWCDKEGYPGNYVFKFSTTIRRSVYKRSSGGNCEEVTDLKTGDFIRVFASLKSNSNTSNPGIYLNPDVIEFIGYGAAISSGPSPDTLIGSAPAAVLPQGATVNPTAPTASAPQVPGATVNPTAPTASAPQVPGGAYPGGVKPAPDFLAPPVTTGIAPPEFFEVGTHDAPRRCTRAELVAYGWTHEQIEAAPRA